MPVITMCCGLGVGVGLLLAFGFGCWVVVLGGLLLAGVFVFVGCGVCCCLLFVNCF